MLFEGKYLTIRYSSLPLFIALHPIMTHEWVQTIINNFKHRAKHIKTQPCLKHCHYSEASASSTVPPFPLSSAHMIWSPPEPRSPREENQWIAPKHLLLAILQKNITFSSLCTVPNLCLIPSIKVWSENTSWSYVMKLNNGLTIWFTPYQSKMWHIFISSKWLHQICPVFNFVRKKKHVWLMHGTH